MKMQALIDYLKEHGTFRFHAAENWRYHPYPMYKAIAQADSLGLVKLRLIEEREEGITPLYIEATLASLDNSPLKESPDPAEQLRALADDTVATTSAYRHDLRRAADLIDQMRAALEPFVYAYRDTNSGFGIDAATMYKTANHMSQYLKATDYAVAHEALYGRAWSRELDIENHPEKWEVGQEVEWVRGDGYGYTYPGLKGVVVRLSEDCKTKKLGEYQVFWCSPIEKDGSVAKATFWTTPGDVKPC